jgi:uncharacterized protein (DUF1684 family)
MKALTAISLAFLLVTSCRKEPVQEPVKEPATAAVTEAKTETMTPEAEVKDWQKKRAERLQAEDGWLSLVGLDWMNEGENVFKVPPAKIVLKNGSATLESPKVPMTIDGKPVTGAVTLLDDSQANGPTVVQAGTVRFQVIKRGPRYALRVKDSQAKTRTEFKGLEYFPIDPKWRVEAKLVPYNPVKKIPIIDITGRTEDSDSPGALVFTVDGKEYRLDPILEAGEDDLFIIFRDATSKDATYPAGRYLYAKKPGADGKVIIDFNKAYNPPCSFTPYATCPLPPLQNRLPFRIEAGEKKYAGGHG